MKLPANYLAAKQALAAAVRIDEVKSIRDKALAMEVYAYQSKDAQLAADSVELKRRAVYRLGELMEDKRKTGKLATGARGAGRPKKGGTKKAPPKTAQTLAEQGIDKHLAEAARKAARTPKDKYDADTEKARKLAEAHALSNAAVVKQAREGKQREKREAREQRELELAGKMMALPSKRYAVIVADPEWKFQPYNEASGSDRAAANHYSTSATEVIASRDVASIAADDCVLFLWATVPMLPDALAVMAAWGFKYKSNYVWNKNKAGTGYWNRNKHEHLLIGTRGNIPAPAQGQQWPSVIDAPVAGHSAKPGMFLMMIEEYFPHLPKIELNRRGPAIPGWDCWGLEATAA